MGKSSLVSALTKGAGMNKTDEISMEAPTGKRIVVQGRDVHVVKIQVRRLVFCKNKGNILSTAEEGSLAYQNIQADVRAV